MIEVADDADPRGVRGPHREARSGDAAPRLELCAEPLVQPALRTPGHQVDVVVAQHRRAAIRVLLLPAFGAAADAQPVCALAVALALDQSSESPGAMTPA